MSIMLTNRTVSTKRLSIKCELRRVTLIVLPGTTSSEIGLTIQALKTANSVTAYTAFHWRIATLDGYAIDLEDGFTLHPQMRVGEDETIDLALIFGQWGIDTGRSAVLTNWLRRLDRRGVYLGAIGGACYELATANLLSGYQCSVPWAYHDSFRELFPTVEIRDASFSWDRKRITCTGQVASLDMVFNVIEHQCGTEAASKVAETFNYEVQRGASVNQRYLALQKMSGKLADAVRIMEENIEIPFTSEEIAAEVGSTQRQIERLFAYHLKCSPQRYYNRVRLKRARSLLRQTSLPVSEVSLACGFISFSHFSRTYRGYFGSAPKEDRMPISVNGENR